MFEPMAFPIPSWALPDQAAIPETSISGAEVPNPAIVRPMINGWTPRFRANADAPNTKRSAPHTTVTNPPKMASSG